LPYDDIREMIRAERERHQYRFTAGETIYSYSLLKLNPTTGSALNADEDEKNVVGVEIEKTGHFQVMSSQHNQAA